MKNSLLLMQYKIHPEKRALTETANDRLKKICLIKHTRHRFFENFLPNLIAGLTAYSFLEKKPSLKPEIIDDEN